MGKIRIQKVISQTGLASRRAAEEMILEGRVSVNGKLVIKLPCFVDPDVDEIRVDGRSCRRKGPDRKVYLLLNKPQGVVCTQKDPQGRPRAGDLVPGIGRGVYCVGRLDVDSTGLIVLTNDGELTQHLTHPRYGVQKTYVVEIDGRLSEQEVAALKAGVHLDGKRTSRAAVKVLHGGLPRSILEIRLADAQQREIQRVLLKLGHKVRRLKRVAIGPVTDRGLKIGGYRPLRAGEVQKLRQAGSEAPRQGDRKQRR